MDSAEKENNGLDVNDGEQPVLIVKSEPENKSEVADLDIEPLKFECGNLFTTEKIFCSRESLIKWTREVAKENGFILVIKSSEIGTVGRKPRLRLACERSGTYKPPKHTSNVKEMHRKGTGTKKCGCPFEILGIKLASNEDWGLKVLCGFHNHPAAKQLEGHAYVGRLSDKEKTIVHDMTMNMVRPRNILITLKQHDKNNVTIMKTIYNARHKFRLCEKAGRSQMQQLMKKLNECKYVEWHRSDESTECVKDLFWAHPTAIELLKAFPYVLIMDCTYKTNRYRLPLLKIVGVTSTNLTFFVAFVYMDAEREGNYIWALEKLKGLMSSDKFPDVIVTDRELALMKAIDRMLPSTNNLLCIFHISKNVLANCKKLFERKDKWNAFMSAWSVIVYSANENEYVRNLSSLESDYSTYVDALNYVKDTWLNQFKEKFVSAWTDKIMHFGNVTTNRVESAHAKLKRHLGSSQGDFDSSWSIINSLLELQHTEIKASFEQSLNVVEHHFNQNLFRELRGLASSSALTMILIESKRANEVGIDKSSCGCVIRYTHGLPCAHEIAELIREGRPIPLSHVHQHWMKLDCTKGKTNKDSFNFNIEVEWSCIKERFDNLDEAGKIALKRKLRELGDPSTTFLNPPQEKVKTKGRPPSKADTSTRLDPSHFELVESAYDIISPVSANSVKLTKRKKQSAKRTKCKLQYIDCFPIEIRQWIVNVIDVAADGHCGFRSIVGLLGFGKEGWSQVRQDLITELHNFRHYYISLYGSIERVDELLHGLSCFSIPASPDKWMTLPDMGHLIASRYNVVLIRISLRQCLTYLPLRSLPPSPLDVDREPITIGFVNDCHFVQVVLDPLSPLPPVACNWCKYRYECAREWEIPYVDRIRVFKSLLSKDSNIATQEIINLDEP